MCAYPDERFNSVEMRDYTYIYIYIYIYHRLGDLLLDWSVSIVAIDH